MAEYILNRSVAEIGEVAEANHSASETRFRHRRVGLLKEQLSFNAAATVTAIYAMISRKPNYYWNSGEYQVLRYRYKITERLPGEVEAFDVRTRDNEGMSAVRAYFMRAIPHVEKAYTTRLPGGRYVYFNVRVRK